MMARNLIMLLSLLVLCVLAFCEDAWGQAQLMPADKVRGLRASFPKLEDARWAGFMSDPDTLIYTHKEMPKAYQFQGGFHSVNYNISADSSENFKAHGRGGNANVDFPWRHAGGTDAAAERGISSGVTLIWLPKQSDGRPWPVVMWRERGAWNWMFPRNTIVGEALYLVDSQGKSHWHEVRIRFREIDYWDVDILRPFPHREDLRTALSKHDIALVAPRMKALRLRNRGHDRTAFDRLSYTEVLPQIPEAVSMKLLDETPFRSAMGGYWSGDADQHVFAPTTKQRASIVPYDYQGAFLGNDTRSCGACHSTTLVQADVFRRRGWYGTVRGSADGIFSFHPVALSSISGNGSKRQIEWRSSLVAAGMIAGYDPKVHPKDRYARLPSEERKFP